MRARASLLTAHYPRSYKTLIDFLRALHQQDVDVQEFTATTDRVFQLIDDIKQRPNSTVTLKDFSALQEALDSYISIYSLLCTTPRESRMSEMLGLVRM